MRSDATVSLARAAERGRRAHHPGVDPATAAGVDPDAPRGPAASSARAATGGVGDVASVPGAGGRGSTVAATPRADDRARATGSTRARGRRPVRTGVAVGPGHRDP